MAFKAPTPTRAHNANILITVVPGLGHIKTTCIKNIIESLQNEYSSLVEVNGFYCEEQWKYKMKIGYDSVSVHGKRSILSRIESELPPDCHHKPQDNFGSVSKYIVDIDRFEAAAIPLLSVNNKKHSKQSIFIVDKIGKMELCSSKFEKCIANIINNGSCIVVATVDIKQGNAFVDKLKRRNDVILIELNRNNMQSVTKEVIKNVSRLIEGKGKHRKGKQDNESQSQQKSEYTYYNQRYYKNQRYYRYNNQAKSYRSKRRRYNDGYGDDYGYY
eukprot:198829_1